MATTQTKSKAYLKNVGKSFGYAALDVFEHYNPTLTNLYKSSKEAVTEVKRSMREAKMQAQQMEIESDKGGLSYILEDLASGKWYNKDRETENEKYLSKIEKEDWGDDTTAEAVTETAKDIMRQNEQKTREISSSMGSAAQSISQSIGYASAHSAEYIVKSYAAQSRALYSLTSNGFDRVTNVLLSINQSIDGLATMGEGLNAHMKNSAIFYINATQSLNRIDANIEKLVKIQENKSKSARGISRKNVKGMENLVDADGNIDLVAYMKMVKDNMDQYKSLAEALKDNKEDWIGNRKGGNMLSNTVVSVVDAMLPKMTKEAMKLMNESLRDAMKAGLARGSMRASRSKNPIANILGDMFLPKDGYKDRIDTSNYEKGAVAWDGIARKSLVEVIPTYLAKIYAALGGEEKYYDYEAGKFVKLEAIKQGRDQDKRVAAVRAGGKMRSDILSDIKKNAPAAKQAQLENEIESFFLQAFVDGYDFVEIASLVNDANFRKKYGITRESAKYIINYITSGDPTKARRSVGFISGVSRGRNEFGNTMRNREASGTSTLVHLENGFGDTRSGMAVNGFATMADNFGKTQAYYLRGIYMMTGNIYGAMQQGAIPTQATRPDRRANASVYFNPDTGRYSRRRPVMTRTVGSGRAVSRGASGSSGITIEDRARYMGMSDEQILEAKKREDLIKKYQNAFSGQQINPIVSTDSNGQPKTRSKFASALAKAKDMYEAPFAAMTDMINSFTLALNNMFWGNKDRKGLIDRVSDYLSGLMNKIFGDENGNGVGLSQAMKDEWTNIKTKVKTKVGNMFGNLGARNRAVREHQMAQAVYNQVSGSEGIPGHARGRQITKTGLIAVSEGELVIPSEFNPYYHGHTNKRQQIANENRIINKFYGAFATGGTVGGAFSNGNFVEEVDPTTGKKVYKFVKPDGSVIILKNKADYAKKLAQWKMKQTAQQIDDNTGIITNTADGINLLGSGLMDFIKASLFGTEKQQEEDKKKINMKLTDIFKEMGNEKGAMGIGAIAGTGVSLLTGAIVGPLAGAALGAGAGLLLKSEKIQNALFGEVDENGNYSKPIGNFIMKKLPNIGITAGLGLVGGTLLGSPVIGAIVGSAIGFAGQSEKVKSRLFGEMDEDGVRSKGGLINKEIRDKIKKAAPNIAAGGIAGLLVGPFGLAGNIIVGSAIGYLSTGEKFHQYFFGDGKEDKGLAGIIHEKIVKGLDDLLHNTSNAMKGWLRKTGAKIGSKLIGMIDKAQNKYNSGQARGLQKAIGWAASVPGRAIKGVANKTGDLVQGLANRRRARNLAQGYDVWNAEEKRNATAAERLAMRSDSDITTAANMDRVIAGADAEQLAQLRNVLTDLRDPNLAFNKVRNKSTATLYAELTEAGVDRKLIDKIIKESGSTNGAIRLEGLLQGTGYDKEKLQAIRKAFNKSDKEIRAAKDTKTATKGNLALLKDKYGINLEGASNADIANYLKLIDYDDKQRFGENGSDLNAKEEKYQDNVVTLLSDMNKNISMFTEYITGRRTETGRYDANIDKDGNAHFWRHGMNAVSADEAIAGAQGQRDIMEFGRDTKTVIAETTTKVINTVTEPVKDAVVGTFDFVKENVAIPLLESVKAIHATAKDLYGIGVKGFNEANPDIDTDSYYGPTSGIDFVNKAQRLGTRSSYLGARIKRGASDVYGAIKGKAEGGPSGSRQTFIDLLAEKVIEKMGGIGQFIKNKNQNSDGTETDENVKFHFDMFGNVHKFFTNNQGEPDSAVNDSETKKSKSIMDKFVNSVHSIPGISTAITGLGGLLGGLKDKLVGTEKEPGLLDKLFSGLFGDSGFLSGLFTLFTGKGVSKLLSGITLKTVAQNFLGPGLLAAGLGGKLDDVMYEATGGAYGSSKDTAYFDKEGNPVTLEENGKYYDSEGNEVSKKDVKFKKSDADNFSTKLWKNAGRGLITGKSSLTSKILGKTAIGKGAKKFASKIANVAKTGWDDAAGAAAKSAAVMDLALPITDGIRKFTNMLRKIKILEPIANNLDNMAAELCEKATSAIASGGAKKLTNIVGSLVVWAKAAFIVIDFTTGYQDARTTLGIIDEPTVPQKIISGLIRAIKNFIPIIGTLIPDSIIVDIFCKYVAPAFGINVDELMKQRSEAEEVAAEHGMTVEQYNKQVLNNYTWTERIGNGIKTVWNRNKNPKNSTPITEASMTGSGSGFVSQYDPRYQGYKVSGQNFAAKGCGPAVAAMAGRALGKNISVGDAVAGSAAYQNGNGVSIDYFQQMLGSRGINTRYISGGSSVDLYNSIAHGDKVVLLGRDPYNTSKANSPFGPNNHYVLATGLDRRGNVIINDPENNGPRSYSPNILNSAKFGVAGSNSGIRRLPRSSRFINRYSGGSSYDTATARQVWAFFSGLNYSPECIAAIMGNMYGESKMNPASIQNGGKGPAAGICQWENYNTKSGRWKNLSDFAASRSKDWTDLDAQLNFIHQELTSKDINLRMSGQIGTSNFTKVGYSISNAMPYDQWKVCKDIQRATYLFEIAYERAGKPRMDERLQAATAYYNLYSGKTYSYTSADSSSAPDDTSTATTDTSSSTPANNNSGIMGGIWNAVSDFGAIFSNAFNKVLGGGEAANTSSNTNSGNYTGSTDTAVVNAAVGDGNSKQKDLVQKLLDKQGQLSYSMSGARDPEKGSADCSSTVNWAYKKVTGTDIGNNTADILNNANTEIIDMASGMDPSLGGTNSSGPNISKLMPGDILLYSRPTSGYSAGRKYRVGHVEMYVGDGKRIGHGGGMGPKVTDITADSKRYIMAKRLKGITAAGSGLVSYQDLANYAGGSSGILINARPGSINNMPVRVSGGRLIPVGNLTGGDSSIVTSTQTMLTNLGANAAKSSGINPELVTKLITSITQILERIANNTAPVNQIYQALVAYIQSGGDSGLSKNTTPIRVNNKSQNNQQPEPEIDSSIVTLVGVLADLAKG